MAADEQNVWQNGAPMIARPTPLISVVTAVYNGERYLAEAIESILRQSFTEFEFIIIYDGSVDSSPSILHSYAAKDARVRLVAHENRGLTPALNEGIALARGQFIARMDADDIALPERLQMQVAYLQTTPDCVIVGTKVMMMDADGCSLGPLHVHATHAEIDRILLLGRGTTLVHPSVMFRADTVRAIGGYREKFTSVQDLDLYLRLAEKGRLANLPNILLKWRQHPASINHTRYAEWWEMKRMALGEAAERRNLNLDLDKLLAGDKGLATESAARDFHLDYAEFATSSPQYYRASVKHLRLSLRQFGFRTYFVSRTIKIMLKMVRGLIPRRSS